MKKAAKKVTPKVTKKKAVPKKPAKPLSYYQRQKDAGLLPTRAYLHPDWVEFFNKNKKKWSQPRAKKK